MYACAYIYIFKCVYMACMYICECAHVSLRMCTCVNVYECLLARACMFVAVRRGRNYVVTKFRICELGTSYLRETTSSRKTCRK